MPGKVHQIPEMSLLDFTPIESSTTSLALGVKEDVSACDVQIENCEFVFK